MRSVRLDSQHYCIRQYEYDVPNLAQVTTEGCLRLRKYSEYACLDLFLSFFIFRFLPITLAGISGRHVVAESMVNSIYNIYVS